MKKLIFILMAGIGASAHAFDIDERTHTIGTTLTTTAEKFCGIRVTKSDGDIGFGGELGDEEIRFTVLTNADVYTDPAMLTIQNQRLGGLTDQTASLKVDSKSVRNNGIDKSEVISGDNELQMEVGHEDFILQATTAKYQHDFPVGKELKMEQIITVDCP